MLSLVSVVIASKSKNSSVLGGVQQGSEYNQSTSTKSFNGTSIANLQVLQNGPGALGPVTITGAAAGQINLWNATTSDVNLRTGNKASSTLLIMTIPVSAAAGKYGDDVAFTTGLMIEILGTAPTSTIPWRGY